MKAGTAQKLVYEYAEYLSNDKIGRVEDNKMVNMQLSNEKLIERESHGEERQVLTKPKSRELLLKYGSVRKAVEV